MICFRHPAQADSNPHSSCKDLCVYVCAGLEWYAVNTSTCPSGCTSRFRQPVHLLSGFFHMHDLGKEIVAWRSCCRLASGIMYHTSASTFPCATRACYCSLALPRALCCCCREHRTVFEPGSYTQVHFVLLLLLLRCSAAAAASAALGSTTSQSTSRLSTPPCCTTGWLTTACRQTRQQLRHCCPTWAHMTD